MEFVEGDGGAGQVLDRALDESRAHVDADIGDGRGIVAARGQVIGKCRDDFCVLAFGCGYDTSLVDIDKQCDIVMTAAGRGLVNRRPADRR